MNCFRYSSWILLFLWKSETRTMSAIGPGIIILAVLWVIAIILCVVLSRVDGPVSYVGIIAILAATIVTLILWFLPRGPAPLYEYIIYDYTYIPRVALISICGILLFFGLIVVAVFHIFDQRRAVSLKTMWTWSSYYIKWKLFYLLMLAVK